MIVSLRRWRRPGHSHKKQPGAGMACRLPPNQCTAVMTRPAPVRERGTVRISEAALPANRKSRSTTPHDQDTAHDCAKQGRLPTRCPTILAQAWATQRAASRPMVPRQCGGTGYRQQNRPLHRGSNVAQRCGGVRIETYSRVAHDPTLADVTLRRQVLCNLELTERPIPVSRRVCLFSSPISMYLRVRITAIEWEGLRTIAYHVLA